MDNKGREKGAFTIKDFLIITAMTVCILLVFAVFHHVLPLKQALHEETEESALQLAEDTVPAETPEPEPVPEIPDEAEETEPEPLTWREKFKDKFTEETVITENSYSSPDISVSVETIETEINGYRQVYYITDIYIADISNFQTYFANNRYTYYGCETRQSIMDNVDAVVSMNGDYCTNQKTGFLIRNGETYCTEQTSCDICVMYYDGTIEMFGPSEYSAEELLDKDIYQSWKFGPILLDSDGEIADSFNTTKIIETNAAPRSGLGYYEPGHYCFVVGDGRIGTSRGMTLREFAGVFKELGCVSAYNMDGGASSTLFFENEVISKPSKFRKLGDLIMITETGGELQNENG